MSSPSNTFECRWHASRQLLAAYLLAQAFAMGSLFLLSIPLWASLPGVFGCLLHGFWVLPRQILLNHPQAFRGLRRDGDGWQVWNQACGWQAAQLRPDSLALPLIVVLRFRLRGEWRVRSICVPRDSQTADLHRRLRVRLKFSRRRWAAPE
ncbi:MAG TPA: protein YgfX [Pseudomonas sp.]|uniref:protein YgfX n=1 Tax=Pseudomonas sp. TaxID=306 RepID=UPI002B56E819|nr:protein YgfX [Pseudomonas sp.]HWH89265.1 protein YgfX [Pseudomonas sp.]